MRAAAEFWTALNAADMAVTGVEFGMLPALAGIEAALKVIDEKLSVAEEA